MSCQQEKLGYRPEVAETAAKWNIAAKSPHAESHTARILKQCVCDTLDVFDKVLPVGISSNDACYVWESVKHLGKGGLQRHSLAEVDGMYDQMDISGLGQRGKDIVRSARPVIDDHHRAKTPTQAFD